MPLSDVFSDLQFQGIIGKPQLMCPDLRHYSPPLGILTVNPPGLLPGIPDLRTSHIVLTVDSMVTLCLPALVQLTLSATDVVMWATARKIVLHDIYDPVLLLLI